jgi:hypothetical protein
MDILDGIKDISMPKLLYNNDSLIEIENDNLEIVDDNILLDIQQKLDKFEKIESEGLNRLGNYTFTDLEDSKDKVYPMMEIPPWVYDKSLLLGDNSSRKTERNSQMIYGECVHLLLNKMPLYFYNDWRARIADQLLEGFDLSKIEKERVKIEAFSVIEKFDFLFDSKSQSEVSFVYNRKEGRIDKIAFQDEILWVVDFKTGVPQKNVPNSYIFQLDLYKKAVQKITGSFNIKTAILWTQNQELISVS